MKSLHVLVREFRTGDEPALWDVFYSSIHGLASADYTPEQIDAWASGAPDMAKWAERMQSIAPFVAEREGRIVGYGDVQADGYIDHFYVSPSVARSGVGSALMVRIHGTASLRGTSSLYSNVSITARPFFEKWGFVVESPQTVFIRGVSFTNFRMSKELAPGRVT